MSQRWTPQKICATLDRLSPPEFDVIVAASTLAPISTVIIHPYPDNIFYCPSDAFGIFFEFRHGRKRNSWGWRWRSRAMRDLVAKALRNYTFPYPVPVLSADDDAKLVVINTMLKLSGDARQIVFSPVRRKQSCRYVQMGPRLGLAESPFYLLKHSRYVRTFKTIDSVAAFVERILS